MPFAYYERLSRPEKLVYQVSDHLTAIRLARPGELAGRVERLRESLASSDVPAIARAVAAIATGITEMLDLPAVDVAVHEVRPRIPGAELHGLYTRSEDEAPLIRVWMRTAAYARVVAFRTFLRTLLHELCHHLDYELFSLPISFHTLGFFKRETSLFHQLVPGARAHEESIVDGR